jgi:PadR family transcriptional regulator PadR
MAWTAGMLSPLLHRRERQGYVKATWGVAESGRKRKHYALTGSGREALAERRHQWEVVAEALDQVWRGLTPMEPGFAR